MCFERTLTYEIVRARSSPPALFCVFQGTNASALEKDIGPEQFPINEHYFGLVNVSIAPCVCVCASAAASHCQNNSGVVYQNTARRDSTSRAGRWVLPSLRCFPCRLANMLMFCFLNRQSHKHSGRRPQKSFLFFLFPAVFNAHTRTHTLLFSLSLETHVTVTRCSRPSTSAGPSGRTCWPTRRSRRRRRTCSHVWLTSFTPSPRRRRKWASSRPRSSSRGCGRKTVTPSSSYFSPGGNPLVRNTPVSRNTEEKNIWQQDVSFFFLGFNYPKC